MKSGWVEGQDLLCLRSLRSPIPETERITGVGRFEEDPDGAERQVGGSGLPPRTTQEWSGRMHGEVINGFRRRQGKSSSFVRMTNPLASAWSHTSVSGPA
jgi:hypothetical protein